MNIIEAIRDPDIFGAFLGDQLISWEPWLAFLKCAYGLETTAADRKVIRQCTGRKRVKRLQDGVGFREMAVVVGRRAGKSRVAALVAAFEGLFAGHEKRLSKGDRLRIVVIGPSRKQARIVRDHLRAIFDTPLLRGHVLSESKEGFELANGVLIDTITADPKYVRGWTLGAAVIDEACWVGHYEESRARNDLEIVRALLPGLDTVQGRLIAISTPHAPRGWMHSTWKRYFANDKGETLCWVAPSRVMNPTLSERIINRRKEEDLAACRAEYFAEWRDDISSYLPREVIEGLVVKGRTELSPSKHHRYVAFCDISGGRKDDAALAIGYREERKVVLALCRRWRPPFNPYTVIREMAAILREYSCTSCTGDNYSAEFLSSAFTSQGITYKRSEKPKSQLYLELLPRICSGEVQLLDNELLISQLANLERRARSGGRDVIDHPQGAHDDLGNVCAGLVVEATRQRKTLGVFTRGVVANEVRPAKTDADITRNRIALERAISANVRLGKPYGSF